MSDSHGKNKVRYEKQDVNLISVIGISAVLIIIFIIILVFLSDFFIASKEDEIYESQLKPESVDLKKIQSEEDKILTTYELLDPENAVFRIPVDQAMRILAEEASKQ